MKRTSTAIWHGSGKKGSGNITSQSHALENAHYAYNTRFENEKGTNPEELIAAAHAGCFTMKLSFLLEDAGFIADTIETTSEVTLEKGVIGGSHLIVKAKIPGISKERFAEYAINARDNCPVSRALFLSITMEATLTEELPANKMSK
ncbi:MAG: OsmC family peroxiredoxin [Bacteroidota bacterium]